MKSRFGNLSIVWRDQSLPHNRPLARRSPNELAAASSDRRLVHPGGLARTALAIDMSAGGKEPDTAPVDVRLFGPRFQLSVDGRKLGIAHGLRNEHTAAQLRRLADRIDAGTVNLARVQYFQSADLQEWVTSGLYIEFEEFTGEGDITEKSPAAERKPIIERPSE
jgi:hypothetical protein